MFSPSFRGEENQISASKPGCKRPLLILYTCILALAEIRRGIELLAAGRRRDQLEQWLENELLNSFDEANMLPITKAIGYRWAVLAARAQGRGIQPSVIDGLVAASALEYDLTLATRNVKDFAGLGVELFNPWEDT